MRHVRGILFVDYVRMLRRVEPQDLARVARLLAGDAAYLSGRIELDAWYPMASFERLGLAILELVGAQPDSIRLWGRAQLSAVLEFLPELLVPGEPVETLERCGRLLGELFDFPAIEVEATAGRAQLRIDYGMSPAAEEAACWQAVGFLEALVEECSAQVLGSELAAVEGGPGRRLTLSWKLGAPRFLVAGRAPRVLVVDDDPLVLGSLQRVLRRWADVTCVASAREALSALDAITYDIVLSDHDLGGPVNGLQLLEEVSRRWPAAGRVLHSAWPPPQADEAVLRGVLHVVATKPVSPAELSAALAAAHASAQATRPVRSTREGPVHLHHLRYARTPTDEEFAAMQEESARLVAEGVPHVALVEAAPGAALTRHQRIRQEAWQRQNEPGIRRTCLGLAFVSPQLLPRIALKALMRVRPFPMPVAVFTTAAEAQAWLERILGNRRLASG